MVIRIMTQTSQNGGSNATPVLAEDSLIYSLLDVERQSLNLQEAAVLIQNRLVELDALGRVLPANESDDKIAETLAILG